MQSIKSHHLLQKHFNKKCEANPAYTKGMLARKTATSISYLSRILSGQRPLPPSRLRLFSQALEIDEISQKQLKLLLAEENRVAKNFALLTQPAKNAESSFQMQELSSRHGFLLEEWYYLAILDLATCKNFIFEARWIAVQIGIPEKTAERALERLVQNECLIMKNHRWHKNSEKIRFPDGGNRELLNHYQKKSLKKIYEVLNRGTDPAGMQRRLILGGSVAVNSKNLEQAREILNRAACEALQVLCEGECDQVYQFGQFLVPLTEK